MFAAPPDIETRIRARLPDALRRIGQRSSWADMMARGRLLDSFLEGPSFDRDGNLYLVDIPFGRIFRMSPDGDFEVVAEYDGEPNGLKLHRDGRIFVADHKHGILILDPASGETDVAIDRPRHERFKGCNDLFFTADGDLYFTDQGQTGLQDPTGRLYRRTAAGRLECVLDRVPSPNGLVTNLDQGAAEAARRLRPGPSRQSVRRDVRGCGDRVWLAVPAAGPAGNPSACGAAVPRAAADR